MFVFSSTLIGILHVCYGQVIPSKQATNAGDYNQVNTDGSYDFGYANDDRGSSFHVSHANSQNVVGGRFGARDPKTGTVKETIYTAGPRGFRARGPDVHRKMDLDQRPRGPIGNKDDPYFDPNEDPSYSFGQRTSTYTKQEDADRNGDVKGQYTYYDDVGERHDVGYIAGKDTGFQVTSAFPDSNLAAIRPLYYRVPLKKGELQPRGHTSIQRGLDGSYRFISAGPDQRRSESSDANGYVRGSYTYLDDKGVQRTVHYVAGPGIGYRVVKSSRDPYFAQYFSQVSDLKDPESFGSGSSSLSASGPTLLTDGDALDLVFDTPGGTAASGNIKPPKSGFSGSRGSGYDAGSKRYDDDQTRRSGSGSGSGYDGDSTRYDGDQTRRPGSGSGSSRAPYKPNRIPDRSNDYDRDDSRQDTGSRGSGDRVRGPDERAGSNAYIPPPSGGVSKDDDYGYSSSKKGSGGGRGSTKYDKNGYKVDGTLFTNVGDDYLSFPPGVSVRAHVQSIDLYPAGSRGLSPSEAIEQQ